MKIETEIFLANNIGPKTTAGSAFLAMLAGWLEGIDWLAILGGLIAVASFYVTVYYKRKAAERSKKILEFEQNEDRRRQELHALKMKILARGELPTQELVEAYEHPSPWAATDTDNGALDYPKEPNGP